MFRCCVTVCLRAAERTLHGLGGWSHWWSSGLSSCTAWCRCHGGREVHLLQCAGQLAQPFAICICYRNCHQMSTRAEAEEGGRWSQLEGCSVLQRYKNWVCGFIITWKPCTWRLVNMLAICFFSSYFLILSMFRISWLLRWCFIVDVSLTVAADWDLYSKKVTPWQLSVTSPML